jgi:hypothetical protein
MSLHNIYIKAVTYVPHTALVLRYHSVNTLQTSSENITY